MAEEQSQNEVSVYAPIKTKFQDLGDLRKLNEEGILNLDFSIEGNRLKLIDAIKLYYKNSAFIFSEEEQLNLRKSLDTLVFRNADISEKEKQARQNFQLRQSTFALLVQRYAEFKDNAHRFLELIQKDLYLHNADGFSTKRTDETINRLYLAAETKPKFQNKYGLWISPEMEIFARMLFCNAKQGRDNIIVIKGRRGKGKTRFGIGLSTTLSAMYDLPWSFDRNLVISEDLAYIEALFNSFQKFEVLQLDEAETQLNRKLWYQIDRIGFTGFVTRFRVKGWTMIVIAPESKALDPIIARDYALFEITINVTGTAIVKTFNKNPLTDKTFVPVSAKAKVAINGQEASDITNQYDLLKIMDIPFFDIEEKFMEPYEGRKEQSLKVSSIKKVKAQGNISNQYYVRLLLELPQDKTIITATDIKSSGEAQGYALSIWRLAMILGQNTGRKADQIIKLHVGDPMLPDKYGFIEIDGYIRTYIERLRAMNNGANDAKVN